MADTKYGHLVKTLPYRQGGGGANAREMVFMQGESLEGFSLNFIIGVYDQTGDWAPNRGAHTHTFDELLLFFGYNDDDLGYLGSDMSLSIGKEREVHKFSVPTVVAAPAGEAHCPLVTEKVYDAFGHFHLALSPTYSGEACPQEGTTDGNKYTSRFHSMKIEKGPGGGAAHQVTSMTGDKLEGLPINYTLGLHKETGEWYPGKGSRVNPYDTCLIFFGHNTDDLKYLGAEITIELGEEHEKHTFDVPTVVVLPKGTPHYPVTCNKLERPYSMMEVGLAATPKSEWVK